MTSNLQPAGSATVPPPEMVGAVAPSCYRVSALSGSLEVSARLKNADDLELLIKVLEANKRLIAKADRSGIEAVVKAAAIRHQDLREGERVRDQYSDKSRPVDGDFDA